MHVAALTLELHIPGCSSLKQKRSRLRSLLRRLHREFNLAAAEVGLQDHHTLSHVACVTVSNSQAHAERMLIGIPAWIEKNRPDIELIDYETRIL